MNSSHKKGPDFVMKDRLTPELRRIEKEVDLYYKSNPLVNLPFATATWYLLAFAEDYMLKEKVAAINGIQDLHALASDFVVELEHPMSWLYDACEPGGQVSFAYDKNLYEASRDLFELGRKYDWFVFAYTCASNGYLDWNFRDQRFNQRGIFLQV